MSQFPSTQSPDQDQMIEHSTLLIHDTAICISNVYMCKFSDTFDGNRTCTVFFFLTYEHKFKYIHLQVIFWQPAMICGLFSNFQCEGDSIFYI